MCWVGGGLGGAEAKAQTPVDDTRASVYRYARPGQETMRVGVWGAVSQPGLYEIPSETNLLSLLSIAGGPDVSTNNPQAQHTITLRVTRPRVRSDTVDGGLQPGTGGARRVIFEAALNEVSRLNREVPPLQDGDVVTVEKVVRERFGWRDVVSIFQAAGTLAVITLNILRFRN